MSNDLIITISENETIVIPNEQIELIISPLGTQGLSGDSSQPITIDFTGQTVIPVNHNRGYKPFVLVVNVSGDILDANVKHLSFNSFNIEFNQPQSGSISYL